MRALTRKPYGVAYFKVNRQFYPRVIRLDKDSIKTSKGIWIIDHSKIYMENSAAKEDKYEESSVDSENRVVEKKEYNMVDFYTFNQGIPIIFFDYNDMVPLSFQNEPFEGTRNPFVVEAAVAKEISASEAELMRKNKPSKVIKWIIAGIVVTGGLYAFLAYQNSIISEVALTCQRLLPLVS